MTMFGDVYDQLKVGDEFTFTADPDDKSVWYRLLAINQEYFDIKALYEDGPTHTGLPRHGFRSHKCVLRNQSFSAILSSYLKGATITREQLERLKEEINKS